MRREITDSDYVHDRMTFRAGDERITLRVDRNGREIIAALNAAKEQMTRVGADSTEEEIREAAMAFAEALFGREQAEKLFELYGNAGSVVNVCGQYFTNYLSKKITRAQKRK